MTSLAENKTESFIPTKAQLEEQTELIRDRTSHVKSHVELKKARIDRARGIAATKKYSNK